MTISEARNSQRILIIATQKLLCGEECIHKGSLPWAEIENENHGINLDLVTPHFCSTSKKIKFYTVYINIFNSRTCMDVKAEPTHR